MVRGDVVILLMMEILMVENMIKCRDKGIASGDDYLCGGGGGRVIFHWRCVACLRAIGSDR